MPSGPPITAGWGRTPRYLNKGMFAHADRIIVLSARLKEHMVARGLAATRSMSSQQACPRWRRRPAVERCEPAWGWEDKRVLGIFGYITPAKGHRLAVAALAQLPQDVVLLVAGGVRRAGDQVALDELQRDIAAAGLGERVRITGFLDDEDVPAHIAACDLLLYPATHADSSYSLVTGLAYGCAPVVASDVYGHREVAERNAGVALFTSGDAGALAGGGGAAGSASTPDLPLGGSRGLCAGLCLACRRGTDAASLRASTRRLATKTGNPRRSMTAERLCAADGLPPQALQTSDADRGFAMLSVLLAWLLGCWQLGSQSMWIDEWFTNSNIGKSGPISCPRLSPPNAARRCILPCSSCGRCGRPGGTGAAPLQCGYGGAGGGAHLCAGHAACCRHMLLRLAALLLAISPFWLLYGRMIRAYSQTMMLAAGGNAAAGNRHTPRAWLVGGLCAGSVGLDLHGLQRPCRFWQHTGCTSWQSGSPLDPRSWTPLRAWLLAMVAVALLYVPWLPSILAATDRNVRITDLAGGPVGFAVKLGMPLYTWGVGETLYPWNPLGIGGGVGNGAAGAVGLVDDVARSAGDWMAAGGLAGAAPSVYGHAAGIGGNRHHLSQRRQPHAGCGAGLCHGCSGGLGGFAPALAASGGGGLHYGGVLWQPP